MGEGSRAAVLGEVVRGMGRLPAPLPRERQNDLARRAKKGDLDARNELVASCIPWVARVAMSARRSGLEPEDLLQEGVIGLIRAVELFDPDLGFSFLTYATNWIRQRMHRAADDEGSTVRVPNSEANYVRKLDRIRGRLEAVYGRVEKGMVESAAGVEPGRERHRYVEAARSAMRPTTSFDAPLSSSRGGDTRVEDTLADRRAPDPTEEAEDREARERVWCLVACLSDREAEVITLRFGLADDQAPLKLQEVGDLLGVSRERVRQIEGRALRRLRVAAGLEAAPKPTACACGCGRTFASPVGRQKYATVACRVLSRYRTLQLRKTRVPPRA